MSEKRSDQIKNEMIEVMRDWAKAHPHIDSVLVNKAKELEIALEAEKVDSTGLPIQTPGAWDAAEGVENEALPATERDLIDDKPAHPVVAVVMDFGAPLPRSFRTKCTCPADTQKTPYLTHATHCPVYAAAQALQVQKE